MFRGLFHSASNILRGSKVLGCINRYFRKMNDFSFNNSTMMVCINFITETKMMDETRVESHCLLTKQPAFKGLQEKLGFSLECGQKFQCNAFVNASIKGSACANTARAENNL